MKEDEKLKQKVIEDFKAGKSFDEIVNTNKVSLYYVKKWTGCFYKVQDIEVLIRKRYRNIVFEAVKDVATAISNSLTDEEREKISDKSWLRLDNALKKPLYDLCKKVKYMN